MKRLSKTRIAIMAALAALLGLAVLVPSAMASMTVLANHDNIKINYDYHGSTVSVSGLADPGVDLIVTISSPADHEKLMRKDREAGVVWMNVEELKFDNVPGFYYIRSTKDLSTLMSPDQQVANNIGYTAIEENTQITPQPDAATKSALMDEFIKYKEDGALYNQSTGDFDIKAADNGTQSYYTLFNWPYQAQPGDYTVTVYEVKNGQIVDSGTDNVHVEEEGAVQALADMASQNGALYGTAAVGIAITAGFGVGMLFKGGGSH